MLPGDCFFFLLLSYGKKQAGWHEKNKGFTLKFLFGYSSLIHWLVLQFFVGRKRFRLFVRITEFYANPGMVLSCFFLVAHLSECRSCRVISSHHQHICGCSAKHKIRGGLVLNRFLWRSFIRGVLEYLSDGEVWYTKGIFGDNEPSMLIGGIINPGKSS